MNKYCKRSYNDKEAVESHDNIHPGGTQEKEKYDILLDETRIQTRI